MQIDFSSFGKRLKQIEVYYFKQVYENVVNMYNNVFNDKETNQLNIFDSTILSISGKLLHAGLQCGGNKTNKHIKFKVNLKKWHSCRCKIL